MLFAPIFVLEIEEFLAGCTTTVVFAVGKVVVVVLILLVELNEALLFSNKVEFSWINWVGLVELTNVEFNMLDAVFDDGVALE